MIGKERRPAFEALVLQGIWLIVRAILVKNHAIYEAHRWRSVAITYMDQHGRQGETAREYRREISYPEIKA